VVLGCVCRGRSVSVRGGLCVCSLWWVEMYEEGSLWCLDVRAEASL